MVVDKSVLQGRRTALKRADSLRSNASCALSSGKRSTKHLMLFALTNAKQSSASFGEPAGQPLIERRLTRSETGGVSFQYHVVHMHTQVEVLTGKDTRLREHSDSRGGILIGSGSTANTSSVPSTASPLMRVSVAPAFGAVAWRYIEERVRPWLAVPVPVAAV